MTLALALPVEDRDRCISRKEYRSISKGMSAKEVARIVGYPGRVDLFHGGGSWGSTYVRYRVCSPWSNKRSVVNVLYVWDASTGTISNVVKGKTGTFRRVRPKWG